MVDYVVEALETVRIDLAQPDGLLAGHDLMSPYVWRDGAVCRMLVRVLKNPLESGDPTGTIYAGTAPDGLNFTIDKQPAIVPGPDAADVGGVEDPTVVVADKGDLVVFYTGVDAKREQGSLLVAQGPDLTHLTKREVLLKAPEGEGNIKEATVAQGADCKFRLFYEYAKDNASRIGMAVAASLDAPWAVATDPFGIREDSWDNWHLSTGPIVTRAGRDPVMFYNGATHDARWRIGWVTFDADYTRITDRCIEPLIVPPPPVHRDGTDIAFAASCLDDGDTIQLYFSIEDRVLRRAQIKAYF